ncbi:MAG: hypothetical protein ABGZ35_22315 [Planctomycetaceae bacterium]|jgi:hypothetical protein
MHGSTAGCNVQLEIPRQCRTVYLTDAGGVRLCRHDVAFCTSRKVMADAEFVSIHNR